jgi:glycosyltransferase involved in cell wall biosynthesis
MPKYSIIIPTYNNCEKFLKPCVDSIIKYTDMSDVELIIVANGCTDNTKKYLDYLESTGHNIVRLWKDEPQGFAKAVNWGIKAATADKIVILNNDTVLLEQPKNKWLERLDVHGVGAVLTNYSDIIRQRFAVFFCVMIRREVFDKIGLLDEQFNVGGCEDIDFCFRATEAGYSIVDVGSKGDFPIYHVAEGTVHDETLVQNWQATFTANELKLAKKHSMEQYKYLLSNNYERAVFLKGDPVFPRETQRYEWAARNLVGRQVLEIGCSTGYGYQFLPEDTVYMGLDYDPQIVEIAKEQQWSDNASFYHADINTFELGRYNTIIAFEVIEHLDNGLEIVEKLKKHCKRLMITVPYNEPKGFWGEHHKLHGLTEKDFPGFNFAYIDFDGNISDKLNTSGNNPANLMICWCDNE